MALREVQLQEMQGWRPAQPESEAYCVQSLGGAGRDRRGRRFQRDSARLPQSVGRTESDTSSPGRPMGSDEGARLVAWLWGQERALQGGQGHQRRSRVRRWDGAVAGVFGKRWHQQAANRARCRSSEWNFVHLWVGSGVRTTKAAGGCG